MQDEYGKRAIAETAVASAPQVEREGRPARRRPVMVAGAVGIVAAATIASVVTLASGSGAVPAALRSLPGRVVSQLSTGQVVAADPDGARAVTYPAVHDPYGRIAALVASPDGQVLLSSAGTVIFLGLNGQLSFTPAPVAAPFTSNGATLAVPTPFADSNQAVIVVTPRSGFSLGTAAVVTIATGLSTELGTVDSVAGDPQSLGAFASIPLPPSSRLAPTADSGIELLSASHPPVTLTTASDLDRAVGQPPTALIDPEVFPDPAGDKIAVVLNPITPTQSNVPLVVLDRDGRVLSTTPAGFGPIWQGQPSWSPDGRLLSYPTHAGTTTAVAVVSSHGEPITHPAAGPDTQFGGCLWSPTDAAAVCLARRGTQDEWAFLFPQRKDLITAPTRGNPLMWLAG